MNESGTYPSICAEAVPTCKRCRLPFICDDEDADEFGTGLCYDCFEASLEEYEERRRERIARENEY